MITKLSNDKNNYLLLLYFIILSIFFVFPVFSLNLYYQLKKEIGHEV